MSSPINAKQRLRAHKLLNTASDALWLLRRERLNLADSTEDAIAGAIEQIINANAELDSQPGA